MLVLQVLVALSQTRFLPLLWPQAEYWVPVHCTHGPVPTPASEVVPASVDAPASASPLPDALQTPLPEMCEQSALEEQGSQAPLMQAEASGFLQSAGAKHSTQECLDESQRGVSPEQFPLPMHCTHVLFAVLHARVAPGQLAASHAGDAAAQFSSLMHCTHVWVTVSHAGLLPGQLLSPRHSTQVLALSLQTALVPLHAGLQAEGAPPVAVPPMLVMPPIPVVPPVPPAVAFAVPPVWVPPVPPPHCPLRLQSSARLEQLDMDATMAASADSLASRAMRFALVMGSLVITFRIPPLAVVCRFRCRWCR